MQLRCLISLMLFPCILMDFNLLHFYNKSYSHFDFALCMLSTCKTGWSENELGVLYLCRTFSRVGPTVWNSIRTLAFNLLKCLTLLFYSFKISLPMYMHSVCFFHTSKHLGVFSKTRYNEIL